MQILDLSRALKWDPGCSGFPDPGMKEAMQAQELEKKRISEAFLVLIVSVTGEVLWLIAIMVCAFLRP